MRIDQMMAEIRETHPQADAYGHPGDWQIRSKVGGVLLAESPEKHRAVELALQAVRNARPKPMTVAQAKAFVKSKMPCVAARTLTTKGWVWFIQTLESDYPDAETEGQAWKAAAAAIQAEEKG